MKDRWARSFHTLAIGVGVVALLTACHGARGAVPEDQGPPERQPPSPGGGVIGSVPPGRSSLPFVLASTGLPTDGIWKSTPALVDLNGDGVLDLAVHPRLAQGARVWFGDGRGTWAEASQGLRMPASCGGGIAVADLNRDGHLDLVVADHCEGVFVYLGDGQGRWTLSTASLNPAMSREQSGSPDDENPLGGAEDVAIGDVNEDGFLDLVVAASDQGGFSVYLGDGSGWNWKEVTEPDGLPSAVDPEPGDEERGGWANRVLLIDIDGDGHLDVVASYYAGPRVWRGDGKGHWRPFSTGLPSPASRGLYRGLAVGDVNEDGRLDLVVAHRVDGPAVYLQQADGTWHRSPSPALASLTGGAVSLALGDLDGDGHLDLVVGGSRGPREQSGLFVFRGNGRAEWREIEETHLPAGGLSVVWGITLGDVNGDGALDVAVATGTSERVGRGGARGREPSPPARMLPPDLPTLQVWMNGGKGHVRAP